MSASVPVAESSASLYVGGLAAQVSDKDLFEAFSHEYEGSVASGLQSSKVNKDTQTRLSRCSGFLNFDTPANAALCLEQRQHLELLGRKVVLKEYKAKVKPVLAAPQVAEDPAEVSAFAATNTTIAAGEQEAKDIRTNCNTFIRPLPEGTTEEDLVKFVNEHFNGEVASCHVPPGRPFGYIQFLDEALAHKACNKGQILFVAPEGSSSTPLSSLVTLSKYKSFTDRNPRIQPVQGPKKTPIFIPINKITSITVRGAPNGWTGREVSAACAVYGEIANIRIPEQGSVSRDIVVEFVCKDSVAKAVEGLKGRYCNAIDQFTLLDAHESHLFAVINEKKSGNLVPRLNVIPYGSTQNRKDPRRNNNQRTSKPATAKKEGEEKVNISSATAAPAATPSVPAVVELEQ